MRPPERTAARALVQGGYAQSSKSRLMAIGSISAVACLALAAAALQLATPGGTNAWPSLGSAAIGVWWMGIAVFLWRK